MDISILLAKFFGLYLLIMSIAMLMHSKHFMHAAFIMIKNPAIALLANIVTLMLGIFLVLIHNIWVWDWRIIITLLVWLTFLKGVIRLCYPDIDRYSMRLLKRGTVLNVILWVNLLLGIGLCYLGFMASQLA